MPRDNDTPTIRSSLPTGWAVTVITMLYYDSWGIPSHIPYTGVSSLVAGLPCHSKRHEYGLTGCCHSGDPAHDPAQLSFSSGFLLSTIMPNVEAEFDFKTSFGRQPSLREFCHLETVHSKASFSYRSNRSALTTELIHSPDSVNHDNCNAHFFIRVRQFSTSTTIDRIMVKGTYRLLRKFRNCISFRLVNSSGYNILLFQPDFNIMKSTENTLVLTTKCLS
ncbi:hypothetical protein F4821DRAFT_243307 [Hypoxylon rubiginosum]|uniref:Uncharacterized protein n=1 Tax=Hypoxylon rubiginosum TaxID=110542 RepID=A0ACC0CUW9_9PEZI|nr:hypothetical protein F4821DRAFT_243307 [Hypoxylon rubiginosum]